MIRKVPTSKMATTSDVCGFCFIEPVFGFCENCGIRLGERCFSNHTKIAIFTGHTVLPLDNRDNQKQSTVPDEKDIHEQKCQLHATDPQSLYCYKHDVTICGRCILIDHKTCTDEIVDLHTTKFDEHKTNELLNTLEGIAGEINALRVRVDENGKRNDELKVSSMDAIKQYRQRIDSRLDQLQLAAEQATEDRHKENMNILFEIEQTCKDISLRTQERGEIIEELSKKKHERQLFIYSQRLVIEIDEMRTAVKQSNIKNHITTCAFKEHPTLDNTLQKEILELGTLQETCDGSEEIIEQDDFNPKVTETSKNGDGSCTGEMTKPKSFACDCQPPGKMTIKRNINRRFGYGHCNKVYKLIRITYEFLDGQQSDGKQYNGTTMRAYLPDSNKGENICRMLKVAFQRKLVFTINSDGVLVFNGIEHQTEFNRATSSYCDGVTAQLEAKGITFADINTNDQLEGTVTVN